MAKKAKGKNADKETSSKGADTRAKSGGGSASSLTRVSSGTGAGSRKDSGLNPSEAFIKLLQSPLVAELIAVAATAALAALAEHGFTSGAEATRGKRAGKAVKEAGKAAAAAVGRRLGTEVDEIRKAATKPTAGAGA